MELVMCRACGEFSPATMDDGKRVPLVDECRECGRTEFKDIQEDSVIEADDDD